MPEIYLTSDENKKENPKKWSIKKRYPKSVSFKSFSSQRKYDGILFNPEAYWQFTVNNADEFVMPASTFYITNDDYTYRYPVYLDEKTNDGLTRLQLANEIIKTMNIFELIKNSCRDNPFSPVRENKSPKEQKMTKLVRQGTHTQKNQNTVLIEKLDKTLQLYDGYPVYKIKYIKR